MFKQREHNLRFVASFVDAVTLNPFYSDLQRLRRERLTLRTLPRQDFETYELAETADAA